MYSKFLKTIPVPGQKLHRDPDTKKKLIDGKAFKPTSWDISPLEAPIMLVDTGQSNIVGVDFDDEHCFHVALSIDPDCTYIAKGVGKGGGHFIYRSSNIGYIQKHITNPNGCNIPEMDLQMGRKLILLATEANETKELLTPQITSYDQVAEMPMAMQVFIVQLYQNHQLKQATLGGNNTTSSTHADSRLHYIVKEALEDTSIYYHKFFNVVTTKKYKGIMAQEPKYPDMPYIPDNLPMEESGHSYLLSIATILGRDPSVDQEMFVKAMHYTNNLFSEPYTTQKLDEMLNYITSGKSKIGNEKTWQYNPDWNKAGMIYTDNFGQSHEVFSFIEGGGVKYLDHNHITNEITQLNTSGSVIDQIKITSKRNGSMSKDRLMERSSMARIISDPLRPFGAIRSDNKVEFNTYLRSEEQEILYNPEIYQGYKRPDTTLRFLENSFGYERCHEFFLPFIKRKFTTYEFSPLIIVLYGPPHSGKSAVTNGILRPFSQGRNINLTPEVATEKYDDWKVGKDIVLIDEVHHTRADIRSKMVQVMNTISGSSVLSGIRAMQMSASSTEYKNTITIFVTCNKTVALSSEAQDRRLVICRSYKTAADALGMSNNSIFTALHEESKDFAYYLATEVVELPKPQYLSNDWLKDEIYHQFQESAVPLVQAIATAVSNNNFAGFIELMEGLHISLEDIVHSSQLVFDKVQIRITNSNDQKASRPSLLNDTMMNVKDLLKSMETLDNVKLRGDDSIGSVKTGNKKTYISFHISDIIRDCPEFLDKLNAVVPMEPLEGNDEEIIIK